MYPNPFYRNIPYQMPMYPPQMPIRTPGFFGMPGGGAGLPRPPVPPVPLGAPGAPAAAAAAAAVAGAGAVPSRIEQFLQSTGQLMKTAQTYAPYVQQAMPMFKNLPALMKLYKGFQNMPDMQQSTGSASPPKSEGFVESSQKPKRSTDYTTKPSLPKIYQP
ncbi:VrrA/YqfQ family protein [Lysinibacillus sp. LZ02]|uniref:VrrA/YqfQ family protein n=1 Tax=Lysinibacillus sp. LZ02 TaxID=3420668 RepID=UPI003D366B52